MTDEELFDDIELNEADNILDAYYYPSDVEYIHYYPGNVGWEPSYFGIFDAYEAYRAPVLNIINQTLDKEYKMVLFFQGNQYRVIDYFEIYINKNLLIKIDNCNLQSDFFFEQDAKGNFLPLSENKCMNRMQRYLNLKAFI